MDFKGKLKKQFNYICSNYEFRFNVVTSFYEYRKYVKGKPKVGSAWLKYSDRVRDNIMLQMMEADLDIPKEKFTMFIESETISPDFNPFLDYFENLPVWDTKTDYLAQICKTVKTDNPERFYDTLKKFFIGTLDCLLEEDAVNDVCLVFQSSQGIGKTRWMRSLLPKQFQSEYLYEGNIDTRNKDHTIYLSQYWYIHLDELEALKANDISAIKSFITRQRISQRKAYGRYTSHFIRRASFLGSVNDDKFLTDITGNRRWLVFIVSQINYEHRVDVEGLWAQIYHLWKEGYKHWFDIDEIKAINKINETFRSMSTEEEQVLQLMDFPAEDITTGSWLTSTDVLIEISKARPVLGSKLISTNIGKALSKYSLAKKMVRGVQRYYVELKSNPFNTLDIDGAADADDNYVAMPETAEQTHHIPKEEYDDLPF